MRSLLLALTAVIVLSATACAQAQQGQPGLETSQARIGYSIGQRYGADLRADGLDKLVDVEALVRGLRDAFTGAESALTEEQQQAAIQELVQSMQAEVNAASEKSAAQGQQFLADNAKKEGVKTLPSGLQYRILKEGDGATPMAESTVTTHYRGTLLDGTEFDSSYRRGEPAQFPVNRVIAGWTEALQLMQVGDKWQLFIPSDLAYGPEGHPSGAIGPNETLIFELELLGVE